MNEIDEIIARIERATDSPECITETVCSGCLSLQYAVERLAKFVKKLAEREGDRTL